MCTFVCVFCFFPTITSCTKAKENHRFELKVKLRTTSTMTCLLFGQHRTHGVKRAHSHSHWESFPPARGRSSIASPSSGGNRDTSISICAGIDRFSPRLTRHYAAANRKTQGWDESKKFPTFTFDLPAMIQTASRPVWMLRRNRFFFFLRNIKCSTWLSENLQICPKPFFLCWKISTNTDLESVGKLFWCLASLFDLVLQ